MNHFIVIFMNWNYHGEIPKAGRRLLLLTIDEVSDACPLIYRMLSSANLVAHPDYFVSDIKNIIDENPKSISNNQLYQDLFDALRELVKVKKQKECQAEILNQIKKVNTLLNQFFNDYGWRQIRKEISQIKKRKKKSHIELSKDIIEKIKQYMREEKLDSFDQAIEELLSLK